MAKDIFDKAIEIMEFNHTNVFGPISLQDYIKNNNLYSAKTADYISIDSFEKLNIRLRERNIMVLRLGSSEGTGTQFMLVKVEDVKKFFIIDNEIINFNNGRTYLPTRSIRQLFAYQVFPFLSETSFVNLGVVSGLVNYALGLNESDIPLAPATGKSTFTFNFKPHSTIENIVEHNNGQVEIDGVFVAERNGKPTVFVLEAKSTDVHKSLSKHKLVYPILSIAPQVPKDMPIVPVYMKVYKLEDGIHYHIIECKIPDPRKKVIALDELEYRNYQHLILPILNLR